MTENEYKNPVLRSKLFLYLTEFFAGMSVMAVELGASRLLAPYFSSSQIVWTIIIGTIMIAMALGNIYGGKKADRDPDPAKLYQRLLISAVWIAAIPFLGRYVIILISALLALAVNHFFLVIAAFLSCIIIFVFPLFLLGTTTPSLVKYTVDSLDDSGKTVGYLNAFNTIGSIIGTFAPTFITIPSIGTSWSFIIFSGILLVLSLIYLFGEVKKKKLLLVKIVAVIILFALCIVSIGFSSFAFWENNLLFEGESVYNYLQVKDNPGSITLSTNVLFGVQSIKMKGDGLTGMYYDYALSSLYMSMIPWKDDFDILVLGMGTGTFASQCKKYFPECSVTGVEIDSKIIDLSKEYFSLPENVDVIEYDGRAFIAQDDNEYDVIMVDAYQDITIPFQMSTVEFFTSVKDSLKHDGVMVMNMNMRGKKNGGIASYLSDTVSSVFDYVYYVDVPNSENRVLLATDFSQGLTYLYNAYRKERRTEILDLIDRISNSLKQYEAGKHIMTDDIAPVELLGMNEIDEIIIDELQYYKDVFTERGLGGLIDSLLR